MDTKTGMPAANPTLEDAMFLDDKLGINCEGCGSGRDAHRVDEVAFAHQLRKEGWTVAEGGEALCPSCDSPSAAWKNS